MSWRHAHDPDAERRRRHARCTAKLRQLQREADRLELDIAPELVACIKAVERKVVEAQRTHK